jgi:hypothetical protein
MKSCIFSAEISKNSQISNFMKILPVGADIFLAHGRTNKQPGMVKLIVAFCNFANAPKTEFV